jgi:hypothetical protein
MPPSAHGPLVVSIIASVLGALAMCLLVARYGLTPPSDESPDRAARRLIVTRFGHAFAGVCFAATGILGLVALVGPARRPPEVPRPVAVEPDRATEGRLLALAAEIKAIATRLEQTETRVGAADGATRRLGDELASISLRARQMERALAAPPPPRRVAAPEPPARESREPVAPREVVREPARLSEAPVPAPAPASAIADAPVSAPPMRAAPEPTVAPRPPVRAVEPATPPRTPPPAVRAPEPPPATPRTISAPPRAPEPRSLPTASRAPDSATEKPAGRATVEAASPQTEGGAAAAKPDGLGDKLREDWKTIRGGFETAGDDFKAALRDLGRKLWR